MFSIKHLIMLTLVSQVQAHPALRSCLGCVDDSYFTFINENYGFIHADNLAHVRKYGLNYVKCLKDTYTHIPCLNSCVRIHLTGTDQNETRTVGWMYDCSTELYDILPFTLPEAPTDLQFYDGEMHFENALGNRYKTKYNFHFEFYSKFDEIETTREYYKREQDDKNDDVLERGVPLDQDESDFIGNQEMETSTHVLNVTPTTSFGEMVILSWLFVLVVVAIVKLLFPKKRDLETHISIPFKTFDNILEEETTFVVQSNEEEEESDNEEAPEEKGPEGEENETEGVEYMFEIDLDLDM